MKTIETKVYAFNELNDDAKQKAREWWIEGSDDYQFAYNDTVEDAKTIGLNIETLDDRRANKGSFIDDAVSCAKAIIENHGPDCETYKTAKRFLMSIDSLNDEYPENEEGDRVSDIDGEDNYDAEKEELEAEFLQALLEDYRIIYNKDCDYRQSNEYVDDMLIANEYTFTEDGKRFG